jgi:nitroreductase
VTASEWSPGETEVLADAVSRAPSVLNTQPWSLQVRPPEVLLFERTDIVLPFHDPVGRDRAISCGAAVANLQLALRVLGRRSTMSLVPDTGRNTLIARFLLQGTCLPAGRERDWFAAISRRISHRHPFARQPVSADHLTRVMRAGSMEGVRVRVLRGRVDLAALADQLEYASAVRQQDQGYQRELSLWTIHDEAAHRYGAGIARSSVTGPGSMPSAGMVRPLTALPDRDVLIDRLARETVLLFVSHGDERADHVRSGIALQRSWLASVDVGLAGAVQTQPLHLPEVRTALAERLELEGHPQVLLRVGHAAERAGYSLRRSLNDLMTDRDGR